ncbi:MAG: 4'-phosphopantetheinyl transferase superfamily protein [Clostridiales Family XIII bacterium]|nr:4'-phosphopantetheinyl transferase superfamily protein [Clostridiales Family XIII bacterium]
MYLYLRESEKKTEATEFFKAAFLDYNARARLGLSRQEAETASRALGPYGKPGFVDIPAHFSISHSGRFLVCIFSDAEVGLDAEDLAMRRAQDARRMANGAAEDDVCARYLRIARRCFRADERRVVLEAADRGYDALTALFFLIWTRKEAYVKYTGRGLGAGLGGFSVLDSGLGVFFGVAHTRPALALSYCCGAERAIEEAIFL